MNKADERREDTILVINTVQDIEKEKLKQVFPSAEITDTYNDNIKHCLGCNSCWIKTPGKCAIKDDFDTLFQNILKADKVIFISEEKFGMVSYHLKNIIDRLIPLVMPYTCIKNGQARHAPRYNKSWKFMLIVPKSEDITYLEHWMKRVAINFHSQSMGVYLLEDKERIPVYVENVPGLFLEFLSTLEPRENLGKIAFIIQGGFEEASQLRTTEMFLKKLPQRLNCEYKGNLIRGGMFGMATMRGTKFRDYMEQEFERAIERFLVKNEFDKQLQMEFAGNEYYSKAMIVLGKISKPLNFMVWNIIAKKMGVNGKLTDKLYARDVVRME